MRTRPYPFQEDAIDTCKQFNDRCVVTASMGLGKAQPLWAKLLTPSGWSLMADITIGDFVIGADGEPTEVIGVYPQGIKDVYRITFSDGSITECCDEHLWRVYSPGSKGRHLLLGLKEFKHKLIDKNGNRKWFIPLIRQVEFKTRKVPIPSYLIGYLLANGCLTGNDGIGLTIPDKEIVGKLAGMLPSGLILKRKNKSDSIGYRIVKKEGRKEQGPNVLLSALRALGMYSKYSYEKKIPELYLYNSASIRLDLLRGLMDGDGWAQNNTAAFFSSSSKQLTNGVRELVMSFGGTAKESVNLEPKYTHNGEKKIGRPSYRLSISLPNEINPFSLKRKAEGVKTRTKYFPSRSFKKVELIGQAECQCIQVAAPNGLYVTDDYIVTHNTPIALWRFKDRKDLWPGLIICPAFLKNKWQREAAKHLNMAASVLSGFTPRKRKLLRDKQLLIANYDILGPRARKNGSLFDGWLEYLIDTVKPGMVVIDESQNLSMGARWTEYTRRISNQAGGVLALSGTPFLNYPAGMWPTLNIVRPDLYPSFTPFAVKHCSPKLVRGKYQYKGAVKLDELRKDLLGTMLFRVRKQDVLKDLPPKIRMVVPVELSDPKRYRQEVEKFLFSGHSGDDKKALNWLSELKYLAAELKMQAVYQWIDNFLESTDEKLLVFGWHRALLEGLQNRYKKLSVLIYGSDSPKQRDAAEWAFQNSPNCRILFGNMKAAGVGLDLTAARNVLFCELAWNPATHLQCEDRCWGRMNDLHGANVYYLVAEGTVEAFLCDLNQRKMGFVEEVLDGEVGIEGFDIHSQLVDMMRNAF